MYARWLRRSVLPLCALVMVLVVWGLRPTPGAPPTLHGTSPAARGAGINQGWDAWTAAPRHDPAQRLEFLQQQSAFWQTGYAQAETEMDNYRQVTRYPPESRPLQNHPDQLHPFEPAPELDVARDALGKPIAGVRLRSTQGPVFLGGNESTTFTISAVNDRNEAIPVQVTGAVARSIADTAAPAMALAVGLDFNDNGSDGDAVASDGAYSARFTPAQQGFAAYAGTVRVTAEVAVAGQIAVAQFDTVYAPEVPATWLGVRETMESGSLAFYIKIQVKLPGVYVLGARVFDAKGIPLALLQFQQYVPAGVQELRLPLFGALVRDRSPTFPLRLVDVEGYLLRPDAFPDRLMLARLRGAAHTTGNYTLTDFSNAEWRNEDRDRALQQYRQDVQEAAQNLQALRSP